MKIASNTSKLLRNVPLPDEIATVHDNAVIIDLGSCTTRIGFSGDDAPRLCGRTVVGTGERAGFLPPSAYNKRGGGITSSSSSSAAAAAAANDKERPSNAVTVGDAKYECFDEAYKRRSELNISHVVQRGMVVDEDGFRALFTHIDKLLDICKDTNTPVLISEGALIPRKQRETLTQILFEEFRFPSLYFAASPVLGMYASGRTSGLAVEMGYGTCQTMPIFEGFGLFHSILQMDMGGDDLTAWVGKVLSDSNQLSNIPSYNQRDVWQYIKEMCCPVSASREAFNRAQQGITHTLPDKTVIQLGAERFVPTEAIFDPTLISNFVFSAANGSHTFSIGGGVGVGALPSAAAATAAASAAVANASKGLHQLAAESIRKCDQDITSLLCNNVVMMGGGSLFAGLPDRFNNELQDLIPTEKVKVYASTERELSAFVGGSILASLPTFQDMWVTGTDYREHGPHITTRNCF